LPAYKRILLVDGDAAVLHEIATAFRTRGWDTLGTRDTMQALTSARDLSPSVVAINSALPGGGGMMALKRIRSNIRTSQLPVIIATAEPEPFFKAGAQNCVATLGDFPALERVATECLSTPLKAEQAPEHVLADPQRLGALKQRGLLDTPPDTTPESAACSSATLPNSGTTSASCCGSRRMT